jgi:hypothetical protein
MTDKEAMKLALDALEAMQMYAEAERKGLRICDEAITALKERLAQPEQEPVAFKIYKPTPPRHATPNVRDAELPWVYDQDPSSGNVASMWVTPVKATPPQRTWVGLTPREIYNLWEDSGVPFVDWDSFASIAQAIQARLKDKNT